MGTIEKILSLQCQWMYTVFSLSLCSSLILFVRPRILTSDCVFSFFLTGKQSCQKCGSIVMREQCVQGCTQGAATFETSLVALFDDNTHIIEALFKNTNDVWLALRLDKQYVFCLSKFHSPFSYYLYSDSFLLFLLSLDKQVTYKIMSCKTVLYDGHEETSTSKVERVLTLDLALSLSLPPSLI